MIEYILSDFWRFCGAVVLLTIAITPLYTLIAVRTARPRVVVSPHRIERLEREVAKLKADSQAGKSLARR